MPLTGEYEPSPWDWVSAEVEQYEATGGKEGGTLRARPACPHDEGPQDPFFWSIYQWLDGEPASADRIADPVGFAVDLAGFVAALQSIDTADGPRPGKHNWFRGATLRTYEGQLESALRNWTATSTSAWRARSGRPHWTHAGTVWTVGSTVTLPRGISCSRTGELAAVIDFGTCGVGDPACDLAIAWTLLTADGRQAFRERLSVDDARWARGRGWALWKTMVTCSYTLGDTGEPALNARHVLTEIFAEYSAGCGALPPHRRQQQPMRPTSTGCGDATDLRRESARGEPGADRLGIRRAPEGGGFASSGARVGV